MTEKYPFKKHEKDGSYTAEYLEWRMLKQQQKAYHNGDW